MAGETRTVVVVASDGRLVDVSGTVKESDGHYAKFASRLLGDDGAHAVLNYGWNSRTDLVVATASGYGNSIRLDALEVIVPNDLRIGGELLQDLVDSHIDIAMSGIIGKQDEIDVTATPAEGESSDGGPSTIYTIGLDRLFVERITNLEDTVRNLVRLEDVFYIGDGLVASAGAPRVLSARLGTGLKFDDNDDPSGSDSPDGEFRPSSRAIAVDCDDAPVEGSEKPITSGAVYDALSGTTASRYVVGIDSASGNMVLYDRYINA